MHISVENKLAYSGEPIGKGACTNDHGNSRKSTFGGSFRNHVSITDSCHSTERPINTKHILVPVAAFVDA